MGDRSHAKIEAYFEELLSDPLIELVMRADRIDRHAVRGQLSRASLSHYPRRHADGGEKAAPEAYRPSVGIALFNYTGEVLMGRRCDLAHEAWQMPQGGIDPGETPEEAARRELKEETGTDDVILLGQRTGPVQYDLPTDLVGRTWGGHWRGQEQIWFAFGFLGEDADINVHTAHPEFCDWKWVPLHAVFEMVVDFKQPAYAQVVEAFAPLAAILIAASRSSGRSSIHLVAPHGTSGWPGITELQPATAASVEER